MKILFIRFSSLGDCVLTTGVIKKLSEMLEDMRIDVLTNSKFAEVWAGCDFVNKVYPIAPKIPLTEYMYFLKQMPEYDYIFDLHSNLRSFIAGKILAGKTYKYKKKSLARRLYTAFRIFKKSLDKHVVQRYAEAVFSAVNLPVPPLEELRPYLGETEDVKNADKVVIHPFASKYTKIWPYFTEFAKVFQKTGKKVYIIGHGDFPEIAGVVRVHTESLAEMFQFIDDASLLVTGDSGPMHAGVAKKVPVLAIFGSTTKEYGFFPSFNGCMVVEVEGLRCRPCHVHGADKCPRKHFKCMKDITPELMLSLSEVGLCTKFL